MKKKYLALLLAVVLAVGLLPGTALAFSGSSTGGGGSTNDGPNSCGSNLTWSYSDGVLTIAGTGYMWGFTADELPWKDYSGEIHTLAISDGVTNISTCAFYGFKNLTSATIPAGVTEIDSGAFYGCTSLTSVTIPVSVTSIEALAFSECTSLTDVYYGGSESQWGAIMGMAENWEEAVFAEGGQAMPGLGNVIVHYNSTGPDTAEPTEPENPSASTFTDVPEGVWYYEAVQWAADKGYIQGYNGEFSPNGSLTRGAIFTILARVDNVDTNGGSTWYEKGMNWAVENGVSDGTSPTSDITLEMLVTMLYRYENKPDADTSVLARFSDSSSIHTWTDCREAMAWAVEIGLVEGSGGKLDPLSTLARSRGAVVLQRYCEKLGK